MAVNIHVKVSEDGDVYCKDDPARMILSDPQHQDEKKLKWHCNEGEFELEFVTEHPFVGGDLVLVSQNKKIEAEVKHHESQKEYVYYVRLQTSAGEQLKADPGLIIKP